MVIRLAQDKSDAGYRDAIAKVQAARDSGRTPNPMDLKMAQDAAKQMGERGSLARKALNIKI